MLHLHKEIWSSKKAQKTLLHNLVSAYCLFCSGLARSRSHRCFSFCVSSPRPAWRCSHDGTSSCACQAYKRWLRHTPAPPWPVTDTHTHWLGPLSIYWGCCWKPSNSSCTVAVILPVLLALWADLWPLFHGTSSYVTCGVPDKLELGSLRPWGSEDKQRKDSVFQRGKPYMDTVGARGNSNLKHITRY